MNTLFSYVKQDLRIALDSRQGCIAGACQCLALLVFLVVGQGPLHAATINPDPLMWQFEQGAVFVDPATFDRTGS